MKKIAIPSFVHPSKLFIFAPLCSRKCVANIVTSRGTHRPRTKYYRITSMRIKQNIRELLGSTSQYQKWTHSGANMNSFDEFLVRENLTIFMREKNRDFDNFVLFAL
jgi:hypothetical protein